MFKAECRYSILEKDIHCGLAYQGPEEKKTLQHNCPGGNSGCSSSAIKFDNSGVDFSMVKFTMSSGEVYSLDTLDMLEPDENGIIDFVVSDIQENNVHIQYDMSASVRVVKDSLDIVDDGIFVNTGSYQVFQSDCVADFLYMKQRNENDTVFVSDSAIKACYAQSGSLYNGKYPVVKLNYSSSLTMSEPSSGVVDPYPIYGDILYHEKYQPIVIPEPTAAAGLLLMGTFIYYMP